jgi:hypothetical protein
MSVAEDCTVQSSTIKDRTTHVTPKKARLSLGVLLSLPVDVRKIRPAQVALPEGCTPKVGVAKIGAPQVKFMELGILKVPPLELAP